MPDVLQIIPKEEQLDAVAKIRTSTPQSLIDTDFEYGLQPTKWDFVNMTNNRPTAFYNPTSPLTITGVSISSGTVTVTSTANPAVGTPLYVQGTTDVLANGWFIVTTTSGSSFTYTQLPVTVDATSGSIYDSTKTYIYTGTFYTGAAIPVSSSAGFAFTNAGTTVTAATNYGHGLSVGNLIYVVGTTSTTNPPNGMFQVATVPTNNTFTFTVANAPTGTITASAGSTSTLYCTPNGFSIHRAYDGGIQFSAGVGSPGAQIIRQTRRYFRYQSGKAIQMSTGSIMKNAMFVDSLTASGTTITVNTKFVHNMTPGSYIQVSGCVQSQYNGIWQVVTVTPTSLTYTCNNAPAVSPATGFPIYVSSYSWYGTAHRIGIMDQQNGIFFEFDGQTLNAVRRQSTQQIAGTIAVTSGSNVVTGTNTLFSQQLVPGSYIVIRGQSYRVHSISSNTQIQIVPEYRAATSSNVVASLTIETRFPQSSWNLDKCDGTGPSGYTIDLTKMQMWYIDYSWYGAGFIRFGLRTNLGQMIYCHKVQNNNTYTEAWMRSGNLPAHYESYCIQPITTITSSVGTGDTTINVASTAGFPNSGAFRLVGSGNTGVVEYVTYTGLTGTTFTGCTRGATGGSAATAYTYSATAPVAVELANQTTNASIFPAGGSMSHWGTSIVMDGGFNNDLLFSFNQSTGATAVAVASGATNSIFSLRVGPSVDTGLIGVLGAREVINRMQLKLQSIRVLSTGVFKINVVLNGQNSAGTFTNVGGSSLSQYCAHTGATTLTSGETIFSFYTNNAGGTANSTLTEEDLTLIRDLGNTILGGGLTNTVPTTANGVYPDGPDLITITAQNQSGSSANVSMIVSWTEAQA